MKKDAGDFFRTNMVRDAASSGKKEEKFPLPMWPFRHMSMESMSVLAASMNEALLQSYDGVIRVAPAFPSNQSGRFTLHAEGGYIVSSEIRGGNIQWICIENLNGGTCRVANPWNEAVMWRMDTRNPVESREEIIEAKLAAGDYIIIASKETGVEEWLCIPESHAKNDKVKSHPSGDAQLGIPRMF